MYTSRDVLEHLEGCGEFFRIAVVPECSSTNDCLKAAARRGESEGCVLLADVQSGGKGRRGRSFFSPAGCGIYMSVLLRPDPTPDGILLITAAAAVAAVRGIESVCGKAPGIKWVNDLYLEGHKICGILAEAATGASGRIEAVVLGIGINLFEPAGGYPDEIRNKAGAVLKDGTETERDRLRSRTAAAVLSRFFELYRRLPDRSFMEEYRMRSILTGKRILVDPEGAACPAVALGTDDRGRLSVRMEDGEIRMLMAGEVSILLEEQNRST